MTFSEAVKTVYFQKYVTFSGRASRSEYWWAYLASTLMFLAIGALLAILVLILIATGLSRDTINIISNIYLVIAAFPGIAIFIALIAVSVRRFHDVNLSGWWLLLIYLGSAIPYLGVIISIILLVITIRKGTDGPNRFGPDPLKPNVTAEIFA